MLGLELVSDTTLLGHQLLFLGVGRRLLRGLSPGQRKLAIETAGNRTPVHVFNQWHGNDQYLVFRGVDLGCG